jgi:adenylate cyclase
MVKLLKEKKMAIEIERKWLIDSDTKIPEDLTFDTTENIRQAYILDKDKHVLRVRTSLVYAPNNPVVKNFTEATITVKGPSSGQYADEYEMKIPFAYGEKFMEGKVVLEKTRKTLGRIELDFFTTPTLKGLVIAEVEFDSLDMADSFLVPWWFGQEVTQDKSYSNANLYKKIGG